MRASAMIAPGTDLKYKVEADIQGFSMEDDEFAIVVRNSIGKGRYAFGKGDMLTDAEGGFYIAMDAVPAGIYYAMFRARIADADFGDGRQDVVFRQYLTSVGYPPVRCQCPCGNASGSVTYTRVLAAGVDDGTSVYDSDGEPVLDVHGTRVKLSMTAAEFKTLIEGRTDNGVTDTLPEAFDELNSPGSGSGDVLRGSYKVSEVTASGSVSEDPAEGTEIGVIYANRTAEELTLTISAQDYATPMGEDIVLLVPPGGYAEANFSNIGGTVYVRGL